MRRIYSSREERDMLQPSKRDGTPNEDFFKVYQKDALEIHDPELKKHIERHPNKYKEFIKYNKL